MATKDRREGSSSRQSARDSVVDDREEEQRTLDFVMYSIRDEFEALKIQAHDVYQESLRQPGLSPEDRRQLRVNYDKQVRELFKRLKQDAEEQLAVEKMQRKWAAGGEIDPAWKRRLAEEQAAILHEIGRTSPAAGASTSRARRATTSGPSSDSSRSAGARTRSASDSVPSSSSDVSAPTYSAVETAPRLPLSVSISPAGRSGRFPHEYNPEVRRSPSLVYRASPRVPPSIPEMWRPPSASQELELRSFTNVDGGYDPGATSSKPPIRRHRSASTESSMTTMTGDSDLFWGRGGSSYRGARFTPSVAGSVETLPTSVEASPIEERIINSKKNFPVFEEPLDDMEAEESKVEESQEAEGNDGEWVSIENDIGPDAALGEVRDEDAEVEEEQLDSDSADESIVMWKTASLGRQQIGAEMLWKVEEARLKERLTKEKEAALLDKERSLLEEARLNERLAEEKEAALLDKERALLLKEEELRRKEEEIQRKLSGVEADTEIHRQEVTEGAETSDNHGEGSTQCAIEEIEKARRAYQAKRDQDFELHVASAKREELMNSADTQGNDAEEHPEERENIRMTEDLKREEAENVRLVEEFERTEKQQAEFARRAQEVLQRKHHRVGLSGSSDISPARAASPVSNPPSPITSSSTRPTASFRAGRSQSGQGWTTSKTETAKTAVVPPAPTMRSVYSNGARTRAGSDAQQAQPSGISMLASSRYIEMPRQSIERPKTPFTMSNSSAGRPPTRSMTPSVPPVNSAYIRRERQKAPGAGSSPIPIPNHRRHGSFGTGYETDVRPSTGHGPTPPGQRGRIVEEEGRGRDHEEMVRKQREAFQRQQQERARQRPPSAPPTTAASNQLHPSRTFLHGQGMEARSKEGHSRKGSHDGQRRENPALPDERRALLQEVKAREESLARRQEALAREKAKYARQEAELRKLEATKAAKGAITKSWSRGIPTGG